jgi:hypothetical protein
MEQRLDFTHRDRASGQTLWSQAELVSEPSADDPPEGPSFDER